MGRKTYTSVVESDEDGVSERFLQVEGTELTGGAIPPAVPVDGYLWYNAGDGIPYIYDGIRSKWLSLTSVCIELCRQGSIKNGKYANKGSVTGDSSGVVLPRNATLVGMTIRTRGATALFSFSYEVDLVNKWSGNISATGEYSNDSLNTDLDAGEMGMIYFSGSDDQKDAVCHLFYRWRYSA